MLFCHCCRGRNRIEDDNSSKMSLLAKRMAGKREWWALYSRNPFYHYNYNKTCGPIKPYKQSNKSAELTTIASKKSLCNANIVSY